MMGLASPSARTERTPARCGKAERASEGVVSIIHPNAFYSPSPHSCNQLCCVTSHEASSHSPCMTSPEPHRNASLFSVDLLFIPDPDPQGKQKHPRTRNPLQQHSWAKTATQATPSSTKPATSTPSVAKGRKTTGPSSATTRELRIRIKPLTPVRSPSTHPQSNYYTVAVKRIFSRTKYTEDQRTIANRLTVAESLNKSHSGDHTGSMSDPRAPVYPPLLFLPPPRRWSIKITLNRH